MHKRYLFAVALLACTLVLVCAALIFAVMQGGTTRAPHEVYSAKLKAQQASDASWEGSSETTALAVVALTTCGVAPNETYANAEGAAVSIANPETANAIDWLSAQVLDANATANRVAADSEVLYATYAPAERVPTLKAQTYVLWSFGVLDAEKDARRAAAAQTLTENLLTSQLPNGSWEEDVACTALALRALKAVACENATALAKGAAWLQAVEQDNSFGTVLESSLAILALADCGFDVGAEREQLLRVQQPDGSFGDIESTVWAVAALADSETENATASIEKATAWLARQKPANEKELALLSLALGYAKKPPPPSRVAPALPALLQIALACAAAATLALLFARLSGKILAGKRRDIYEYIRHRPGAHLSAIQRRFELSPGETTYHLRVLEKSEYIVADKWGRYKRFYVNGNGYREMLKGACYKRVISALKNETARRIVHVLLATKSATQKELAERLGVHPSTINWHAKNLSGAGILDARVRGRYVHYRIKEEALVRRALQLVD